MINNSKVRNVQVSYPIIEGLTNPETLGKIRLKNLYPQWNGESVNIIKDKHEKNPYAVRIGTPKTDANMRDDRIYFISHYLSYNPITQDLENRDIISRRIMDKLYVGQTTLEANYKDCKVFIDGSMALSDIYLTKSEKLEQTSLTRLVLNLMDKVDQLSKEVSKLKVKPKQNPIYTKDSILDE
tara:strand:- start:156 stop:704 length:549 start_codon:yes stop_codon:yes gene_type:complete